MVGLTNPRQRTRHHSYDFAGDRLPTSRSPSPHGLRRPPRSGMRVRGGSAGGGSRTSKLPLLGPPLIFVVLLWIGLHAGGPDNTMPTAVNDNRGSRLVVDPEEMMRQDTRLRLRGSTGRAIDANDKPQISNKNGAEEIVGDAVDENGKVVIPLKDEQEERPEEEEDDQHVRPPPLPDNPDEIVPNHIEATQQKPQREMIPSVAGKETVVTTKAAVPKPKSPPPQPPPPPHKVVSLYLEPRSTLDESTIPLPPRKTSADLLERIEYPEIKSCSDIPQRLPVNHWPDKDPFLPWIHDYFVSPDGHSVQFIAANKRRCETGHGKESAMAYLQAQVSLFQPLPVARTKRTDSADNQTQQQTPQYRLASLDDPNLVATETRFQCRFHRNPGEEWITFSRFAFNYEYVLWRKRGNKPMFVEMGSDVDQAELSQLLFSCPIPQELRRTEKAASPSFWVDLVPIRTPTRKNSVLLTTNHTGPQYSSQIRAFNASKSYGKQHVLPTPTDAGRWANLPVCLPEELPPPPTTTAKPHTLTACMWASASYRRPGGEKFLFTDTTARLREWLHFHRLVGMDHIYLYDNTPLANETAVSPLQQLVHREFADFVSYISWPAQVCNNRKSNGNVPGEWSSQYAAEASCLQRFGPSTEWMTFLDEDEYLIPTGHEDWKHVLAQHTHKDFILSLRSARGRPRLDLMHALTDTSVCEATKRHLGKRADDACLEVRSNETFLKAYNCDNYPPPRPETFVKSKKQIVRPSYVLQHVVNNATVTRPLATYYHELISSGKAEQFTRELPIPELFLDEVLEGFLLHAKTVPPPETMLRSQRCQPGSRAPCTMGYVCPASTARNETLQRTNGLRDEAGKFCNCWVHPHVENHWIPRLEQALSASRQNE